MQGTKACLGWDRGDASAGVHPSTLPVDLWLGLLQHALHAIRMLGHAVESTPLGREVASNRGALQELLSQLIVHWKARACCLSCSMRGCGSCADVISFWDIALCPDQHDTAMTCGVHASLA